MNSTHDVGISIEKSEEVFEAEEEAFAATQNGFCELIVEFLQFPIDVLENQSDDTANGKNQ